MTPADIILINEACYVFENQLKEKYPDKELPEAYKAFLFDIGGLIPDFFEKKETLNIIKRIKESQTFDKIWIKANEKINSDQQVKEETLNFYCINPSGDFIKCLILNNKKKTIGNFLNYLSGSSTNFPVIIVEKLIQTLTEDDYNDEILRMAIAFGIYYQFSVQFYR